MVVSELDVNSQHGYNRCNDKQAPLYKTQNNITLSLTLTTSFNDREPRLVCPAGNCFHVVSFWEKVARLTGEVNHGAYVGQVCIWCSSVYIRQGRTNIS